MSSTENDRDPAEGKASDASKPLVARAGRYYRTMRYLMALICVACGLWFAYDGWVTWPRENAEARQQGKPLPHSEGNDILRSALKGNDIPLQRLLAIVLPMLGVGLLVRMFYKSRGQYRLEGDVLLVPGHPPVPLSNILRIDKTRWDKKGIARLEYETPGASPTQWLTLDDFVYDRDPTDAILARIEAVLLPPESADAEGGEDEGDDADSVTPPRDEVEDT